MDDIVDAEREQVQDAPESHLAVIERLGGEWVACPRDAVRAVDENTIEASTEEWIASDTLIDASEVT